MIRLLVVHTATLVQLLYALDPARRKDSSQSIAWMKRPYLIRVGVRVPQRKLGSNSSGQHLQPGARLLRSARAGAQCCGRAALRANAVRLGTACGVGMQRMFRREAQPSTRVVSQ